ncbi:MAG: flavodoxin [Spirochaetales bacterium]|nr:MAG: flavodoxin [Spirochaetales bacterium]
MGKSVLVAYASKYGATREIAERIASVLTRKGMGVTVADAGDAGNVADYDATVMGSAVYMGRTRKEARLFLSANADSLSRKPVWLFSSGPTDSKDDPGDLDGWHRPGAIAEVLTRIAPRERVVFGGAITTGKLRGFDKWILSKVGATMGDARNWTQIESWAEKIADDLARL